MDRATGLVYPRKVCSLLGLGSARINKRNMWFAGRKTDPNDQWIGRRPRVLYWNPLCAEDSKKICPPIQSTWPFGMCVQGREDEDFQGRNDVQSKRHPHHQHMEHDTMTFREIITNFLTENHPPPPSPLVDVQAVLKAHHKTHNFDAHKTLKTHNIHRCALLGFWARWSDTKSLVNVCLVLYSSVDF